MKQSQNSQLLTFIYEGALFVKLYLVPFSNQVSNLLLRNIFLHMFSSLWVSLLSVILI